MARPAIQRAAGPRRFVRQATLQRSTQAVGSIQAKFVKSSSDVSTEVVPEAILSELESMLDAADKQNGQASPNFSDTMKTLLGADKHFKDQLALQNSKKMSSQDTFGIGGASYFPGVMTTVSVGSGAYGTSVAEHKGMEQTTHLGGREACIHGEVALITAYPGLQSVVTTQQACLFCYGLLCMRGYEHQALRPNPWPQKWTHDYMKFMLILFAPNFKANVPVVEITWKDQTRYYKVTKPE